MRSPLKFLFSSDLGRIPYALVAVSMSLGVGLVALLILVLTGIINSSTEFPSSATDAPFLVGLLGAAVIGPLIETLMMVLILRMLRFVKGPGLMCLVSGLVWGGFHSLFSLPWGIIAFGMFIVFTAAFLRWERRSTWEAVKTVWLIHGLHNGVAFLASSLP